MRYKYYQPNRKDLKDKYGDCVIRALTKLLDKDWLQVFDDLLPYARELQCMPNGKACFSRYPYRPWLCIPRDQQQKGLKAPYSRQLFPDA